MPKRKRDDAEDTGVSNLVAIPSAKQQRIQHKITHGAKKLGDAFKIAKGFERQKLGRRHRTAAAQKNEKDVQRIDQEISALKGLETPKSALQYLYKTLLKLKAVAGSDALPEGVRTLVETASDTASLNVNARLCNSNPVKQALPAVLSDIQQALGLDVERVEAPKKQRLRAKDLETAPEEAASAMRRRSNQAQQDSESLEGGNLPVSKDQASENICDTDDLAQFNDRLAPSDSGDVDAEEDFDASDLEQQLLAEGVHVKSSEKRKRPVLAYDHAKDLSLSPSTSPSRSTSPEPQKAQPANIPTFVPSLTMGGYISGSGSDLDSDLDIAPRKNRRGQRARQQIWEKKYGGRAKHLLNSSDQNPKGRDAGWDPKRGAVDGSRRAAGGSARRGGFGATLEVFRPTGGNDREIDARPGLGKKHRDDAGPLHPSWEAKKKAKEAGSKAVAFAGKKITFD